MKSLPSRRLCLFGRPRILVDGLEIDEFATKRSAYILARLALAHQRQTSRARLAEVLWPDDNYEGSRLRLRQELSRLRKALGDQADILVTFADSIRLDLSDLDIDVDDFARALRVARETDDPARRLPLLSKAIELSSEPFMAEADEEWIRVERVRLNVLRSGAIVELGNMHLEGRNPSEALTLARDALDRVPEHEGASLLAVRALRDLGHRDDALVQLRVLRRIVSENHGRSSPEVEEIAAGLLPAQDNLQAATLRFPIPFPDEPIFGCEQPLEFLLGHLHPATGEARLVTVLGMGGIGKTHLLRHAGQSLAAAFEGRVIYVDLSNLKNAELIPTAILQALGLGYTPTGDPIARLVRVLATAPTLLALDNLEQFGSSVRPLVRRLIAEAPTLRVLSGSRVPLRVPGELRLRLTPLQTPPESAEQGEAELSPAMKLFMQAMDSEDNGLSSLRNEDWPVVSNIVRRLEGVPLGLQLAASRIRTLGPVALLRNLDDGLDRLVNRMDDVPERHRSIRNAVSGSLDQLDPLARKAMADLSVFRGGWTLDAAAQVCRIVDPAEMMDRLIDASLIYVASPGDPVRFRMLETIREYAQGLLSPHEADAVRKSLTRWLVDRSRLVASQLNDTRALREMECLEPELDNLREAIHYAMEHDPEAAFTLGANLSSLWLYRTSGFEANQFYQDLFRRHGDRPPTKEALRASFGHAEVLHVLQTSERPEIYERTLRIGREIGDRSLEIRALVLLAFYYQNAIRYADCKRCLDEIDRFIGSQGAFDSEGFASRMKGLFAYYQGDLGTGLFHLRQAVEWFRTRGELFMLVRTRMNLAQCAIDFEDYDLAHATLSGLLEQAQNIRFSSQVSSILSVQGRLALWQGRYEDAERDFERSRIGWREFGSTYQEGEQINLLGRTYFATGRLAKAQSAFVQAAELWLDNDLPAASIVAVFGLAAVQLEIGNLDRAARLLSTARHQATLLGAKFVRLHSEWADEIESRLPLSISPPLSLAEAIAVGKL